MAITPRNGRPATGMTFVSAFDAAQGALPAAPLAAPLTAEQGCSMACSHRDPAATARRDVAHHGAPQDDGACLLQCLFLADRCDRNCAGCAVSAARRGEGAPPRGESAAAGCVSHTPPSNTGVNKVSEVGNVG